MLYHGCLCICILVSLLGRVFFLVSITEYSHSSHSYFLSLLPAYSSETIGGGLKTNKTFKLFSHQRDNCNITGLACELCHSTIRDGLFKAYRGTDGQTD